MKVSSQLSFAALISYATAASVDLFKRETPLSVVLSAAGNTEVNVAVTNNGNKTLNLLSKGTFLDEEDPVEKVTLYSNKGTTKVPFEGIKIRVMTSGLGADDYLVLKPKETKKLLVETAALHTLDEGGKYQVFAKGSLPYAEENSFIISGTIRYESNILDLAVDGSQAAKVKKALVRRTVVGPSCTGARLTLIKTALTNCAKLATAASTAAAAGTKLDTYFKSTAASTKNTVSGRLTAIAQDCGTTSKNTSTNCDDQYDACKPNVLAYAVPSKNYITYCPLFDTLPALATKCHGQDHATTALHEEAHAESVYKPGTDDLGYGFTAATKLSTAQALNNADTFALYANAIYLNC